MISDRIADMIEAELAVYASSDPDIDFEVTIQALPTLVQSPQGPMPKMETVVQVSFVMPSPVVKQWLLFPEAVPQGIGMALQPDYVHDLVIRAVNGLREGRSKVLAATNGHKL